MTTTTDRRSALFTPEAVRVDLPLADVGSRTLAILIDLVVIASLLYLVLLLAAVGVGVGLQAGGGPGWVAIVAVLVLNFLVLWGYPTGCEVWFNGRTAGKAALGLRVVTLDGAPIRFRHAAIRGLFAFIDFYLFLGIPALVSALVTSKGQRLGDLAAGTVTIRDRAGGGAADQAVAFHVPPSLQGYARTLDVRGLTTADYAVVRRFLLRAGSLRPPHRDRVAADLANALADRMRHRPPPGTHPEALLLCTAALLQQTAGIAAPRQIAPPPAAHPPTGVPPLGGPPAVGSPPGGPPAVGSPPAWSSPPAGPSAAGPGGFAPPS